MIRKALGTHDIARICHVTPPAVIRWLDDGKIPSFTTGGGHRRVWSADLIPFMKEHNIPVPDELRVQNGRRILIVDDEANNRRLIRRVVKKEFPDAELDEAADGFEAGHKVHSFLPTLVVLDIRLPGLDGYRVCRMFRGDPKLESIKILAISGFDVAQTRQEALDAGADDFLGKPFDVGDLTKKLAELLAQ